jgi:hypothetical protein
MARKNLTAADRHGIVHVFQISICVVALVNFSGCATGNYKKADAASESLRRASLQIDAENHCIDMTLVQLENLVNKPAPDLKPQFEAFSASLDRLVASVERADKAAAVASQKSKDYFQDWDKEAATINFEAVRDQSVSRKTQVSNEFNTVDQRYRENQAVIKPLISYLQDIHTALSTDLTMGGLQSVKPLVDNAEQNADKVQSALERLTTDLDASRSQMSSVVPQETEARGGVVDTDETIREHAQSPR